MHLKIKNYSEAAKLFKTAIKFNENDDDARYNFAICNSLKKESEKNQKQNKGKNRK